MKNIVSLILTFTLYINVNAQTVTVATTGTLLPDQNPNYQKSKDKYMAGASEFTKNEGVTIQETYKAIDDVQAKKERKELAVERHHERRMARIQTRGYRRQNNNRYNNNGDCNNYNNGYYNNNYNQGFYSNPLNGYYPQYNQNNRYNNFGSVLNTALLGLTIWSLLKH